MKNFIFTVFTLIIFSVPSFSQNIEDKEPTCYQKYAKVFEKRGAHDVEDGTYNDVIITFRKGSMADCFYGKVTVRNENVVPSEMYLRFEDESYEKIVRKWRYPKEIISITNGMSRTMVTADGELIDVLFTKKIKPKKKSYVKAADPDFDF